MTCATRTRQAALRRSSESLVLQYLEQEASQAFRADQASTRVHGELLAEPEIDAKLMELSTTDTECEMYSQLSSRTRDVLSRTFPDWKIQDAGDVLSMATSRSYLRSMPLTPASQTLPANLISSDLDKSVRWKPEQDNLPEQTADDGLQLISILGEAIRLRLIVGDHVSLQLKVMEEHSIHPGQSREHGTLSIPPPGSTSAHHNCATTHRMPGGVVADGLAATAPIQQSDISSWQREGEEHGTCHSCFTVHQFHRGQRDYLREISIQKKYRMLEMQLNQALAGLRSNDFFRVSQPTTTCTSQLT